MPQSLAQVWLHLVFSTMFTFLLDFQERSPSRNSLRTSKPKRPSGRNPPTVVRLCFHGSQVTAFFLSAIQNAMRSTRISEARPNTTRRIPRPLAWARQIAGPLARG